MKIAWAGVAASALLAVGLAGPGGAQGRPSIAIMPTIYFSANQESADRITAGLAELYERQGYTVIEQSQSDGAFSALGLQRDQHYPDSTAIQFGRRAGAQLVAYPRLLAVGIPATDATARDAMITPDAVLHLRVLNVNRERNIYFRQIGHEFGSDANVTRGEHYTLPQPVATATAAEATDMYFQRVAGSRQETGR